MIDYVCGPNRRPISKMMIEEIKDVLLTKGFKCDEDNFQKEGTRVTFKKRTVMVEMWANHLQAWVYSGSSPYSGCVRFDDKLRIGSLIL